MPEIPYPSLKKYIQDLPKTHPPPVFLIFGEEFLYRQAVREIVNAIIPDPVMQRHHYDVVHQKEQVDMVDIIDRMNTYSFFSEKKLLNFATRRCLCPDRIRKTWSRKFAGTLTVRGRKKQPFCF